MDRPLLNLLHDQLASLRVDQVLQYRWVETWVKSLKTEANLAPGTIRKRVGAMARMIDWHLKREAVHGAQPLANPFRLLPKNYSVYNEQVLHELADDPTKFVKVDQTRDRRLLPGEYERIAQVLQGGKRDDRERALELPDGEALFDLFCLIVDTGLRLREAYRLRVSDVRLQLRTLHIRATKTGAARDVPILPSIYPMLESRVNKQGVKNRDAPIFPWWSGSESKTELKQVTEMLSQAFARAFAYANCSGLREHDLRHEATCRWILMRDNRGGWLFRTEEAMRITGHKDPRTFMRYVSLRGSDLAERLWPD